ncbi:MAG: glycosyltransferase family 2 protein [Propylenella sp.]
MTDPLVTLGVPVYRGQDRLPALLECLRTQSYRDIEVLISVDGGDQPSADACEPFLRQDSRFRMHVQPTRLGWAGNTDWTMRNRRGDFYVYQQHDDLLSPTYIAELVAAAARWPNAVICFSKVQFTGLSNAVASAPSLLGDHAADRALLFLRRLDWVPFRGLMRGSALDRTSGLLLSDFDPFDSYGTELRIMTELALQGEFRFVEGPTYFKSNHGENVSFKRAGWSREHRIKATACFAAWMIEVLAPAGETVDERRRLFRIALERFAGRQGSLKWIAIFSGWLRRNPSKALTPLRIIRDKLKQSERVMEALGGLYPIREISAEDRPLLLKQIFERLKGGNRFEPGECLNATWEALEAEVLRQYRIASF